MRILLAGFIATGSLLAQSLVISPAFPTVTTAGTAQFTAAVTGTSSPVNWYVAGILGGNSTYGTIVSTGVNTAIYTAPPTVPSPSAFRLTGFTVDTVAVGRTTITVAAGVTSQYTVTYAGNGATSGAAPVDGGQYSAGSPVTVLGNVGNLVEPGYVFAGWNTAANGSGTSYSAGSTFAMGSGNVTLYAQWNVASPGYSVIYAGNGSTSGAGPSDPGQYSAGQTVTVYGNLGNLFKPGYSFAGWNTAANGSGSGYAIGATLSMPTGGITLYAQWSTANVPVSIWGGSQAAVALKADGTVWSWGSNNDGQLGNGNTGTDSDVPVQVVGQNGVGYLSGITAIMGAEEHKFALRNDGTVWAWGMNSLDQLGDGNLLQSATPVQVSLLHNVTKLGGRAYHSLAVQADGSVWAWGYDARGALGIGVADTNSDYPVPVQVQGLTNPIMVSAGYCFSVALLQDHTLVAWGSNKTGQLGNGTGLDSYTPTPVVGLTNVVWVSAGWAQVVAIKADGTVWTWGSNTWNGYYPGSGLLGDGTTANHSTPEQVPGLSGAIMASGGDSHTLVLLRDGTVWGFGSNSAGQLGTGAFTTQSLVPVQVQGLSNVVNITARDWHSQAIKADGTVWSWGSGQSGELGNGTTQNSAVPVLVRQF